MQVWIATKRFRMVISRAVRSSRNVSTEAGSTERIRAVASRTAAIRPATSVLSTTRRRPQHTGRAAVLDRLEIEILQDRASLSCHQRPMVAVEDDRAITKDTIGEAGRRLVEQHEVNPAAGGGFEASRQTSQRVRVS